MSDHSTSGTDRNDAEYLRSRVIAEVRDGAQIARSGAWLAERDEEGNIQVYHHDKELELPDDGLRADGGVRTAPSRCSECGSIAFSEHGHESDCSLNTEGGP